jgi:hypothetical protein
VAGSRENGSLVARLKFSAARNSNFKKNDFLSHDQISPREIAVYSKNVLLSRDKNWPREIAVCTKRIFCWLSKRYISLPRD